MALKIRRGPESQRTTITPAQGELIWSMTDYKLYVGDGLRTGGISIAENLGGLGIAYNGITRRLDLDLSETNTDSLVEGVNNLYYNANRGAQGAGNALVAGNAFNTGITFSYDDVNHRITAVISSNSTLPNQSGHANQFLKTDGSNTVSWATPTVAADTNPALGGNLGLASHNITGTGNIDITGSVTATYLAGDLKASDSSTIVDATAKTLTVNSIALNTGFGAITGQSLVVGTAKSAFITQAYSAVDPWITFLQSQSANPQVTPVVFARSRGTSTAPAAVQTNDTIVNLSASAYTGSTYSPAGAIVCVANGAISAGVAPSAWVIRATDTVGGLNSTLAISAYGVVSNRFIQFGSYTTSQRDSIISPTFGSVIYNTTDNKFQGYQNTSGTTPEWVNIS